MFRITLFYAFFYEIGGEKSFYKTCFLPIFVVCKRIFEIFCRGWKICIQFEIAEYMRISFLCHSILRLASIVLGCCLLLASCRSYEQMEVVNMRCEYSAEPVAIDGEQVRFTWVYQLNDALSGFTQRSVEVRVAESEQALSDVAQCVATSGRVRTSRPYVVLPTDGLKAESRYCWQVRVYNNLGREILCSPVAWFSTAKLHDHKWQGRWITDSYDKNYQPAPMFRKRFTAKRDISSAKLYISAAGYYDAKINGERVSDEWLNPAFTHYDKRNLYLVHDVTELVREGANVITTTLGNGFYNEYTGMSVWDYEDARWRNRPRMICELQIEYKDGGKDVVASDASWRTATGEVLGNVIYAGDIIDARCEVEGWDDAQVDDSSFAAAAECAAPSSLLVAQQMPPIRASETVEPTAMKQISDREYVFTFAENMAGVCTLNVRGEAGTRIEMEHGELLKADSTVEMGNIAIYAEKVGDASFQQDVFILKGDTLEEFTPRFHYNGFQYVTVRADKPIELSRNSLKAHFLHTDVESVGDFRSSNEMMNKLWRAVRRSYLSNLYGIPTDCPHREKNGWTADAHVSIDIALTNYDAILAYEKWIDDFVDNQRADGSISGIIPSAGWGYDDWIGPVWDAAMFIIPNALYNYYGDKRAIEKIYPVAERYLQYLAQRENEEGTVTYGIGDWCYYKTQTPTDFTTTCFYYYDNLLMARFAELLGYDSSKYETKAIVLRELINNKYLDRTTGIYSIGKITAQALPLALGIAPEEMEKLVAARLNEAVVSGGYICDFGLLGSKYALRMLVKYGYVETAYRLATQTRRPSWGNWIENGFTTPLETWAIRDNFADSSANHVFFGDIAAWMQSDLAGINYDESQPGFENIIIRPHFPEEMEWAEASFKSVRGVISSAWHRSRSHNRIILEVTIPVNTTATIYTDGIYRVQGNGKPLRFVVNARAVKSKYNI